MEIVSVVKRVKEIIQEGTSVEILKGDGDNTLIPRLKKNLNIILKKKLIKATLLKHNLQSVLSSSKENVKLSKTVIMYIQKC